MVATDTSVDPTVEVATPVRARFMARSIASPIRTSLAVAGAVRMVTTLVLWKSTVGVTIPDEAQYVSLARWMAAGFPTDGWAPGYAEGLYRSTRAFTLPLIALYQYTSTSRFVGQLLAAAFSLVAVGGTVWLARRVVGDRSALGVGLVMALLPSQVLFSSVVLRESEVWAALVVLGVACAIAADARRLRPTLAATALATMALLALGALRDQTLFAAVWSAVVAVVLAPRPFRLRRATVAVMLALVLPIAGGVGVGGWSLVTRAIPSLGRTRTTLALNAESAFRPLISATRPGGSAAGRVSARREPRAGAAGPARPGDEGGAFAEREDDALVGNYDGSVYVADESVGADIAAVPSGLIGVLLRPWPGESSASFQLQLAGLENVVWYLLYGLGLVGVWSAFRRHRATIAYPIVLAGAIALSSAVSQGNLGTAFRHRQQLLWCVALMAVIGRSSLLGRRERPG